MKWLDWLLALFQPKSVPAPTPREEFEALQLKYKDQSAVKPNRKQCQELLQQLRPELYEKYSPHYGLSLHIGAETPNLEAFTKKLLDATAMVIREQVIPNDWVKTDEVLVSFDKLFVTTDGFYINQIAAVVTKYKTAAARLCEMMEPADNATVGIYEHNQRVISRLFVQMRDLTASLVEVSLQQ